MKPKLLVVELWGLGDLTMATTLLRAAVAQYDVVLLGKGHAAELLAPTFPQIRFVEWDAPWTAFRQKYHFWQWRWRTLLSILRRLRGERFDVAVSVREDPRDHLLLRLAGARRRYGFPKKGSGLFLTDRLARSVAQHRVADWQSVTRALVPSSSATEPILQLTNYTRPAGFPSRLNRPIVCVHTGARIAVRRWPERYFRELIVLMRDYFDFALVIIPDPDGYGSSLGTGAECFLPKLSTNELVGALGGADVVIGNDTAVTHVAAACGTPVIALFGPTNPAWYSPWGNEHHVVIRDICPYRPCFDYCVFEENYCLTKLTPNIVWPEIRKSLQTQFERSPPAARAGVSGSEASNTFARH